jgi:rare lipoprotein A (peptidoglycan hydrolase)
MHINKNSIWIGLCLSLITIQTKAQNKFANSVTTLNYLDSTAIKRYGKHIDTGRIHIGINHITGIASFYSFNLNGTLTSTGERYRNTRYTAACNLFKLNTLVRVTNLRNGNTVMVRINDRMHPAMLRKGRIIDLSQAAAKKLLHNSTGVVRVSIEALGYSKINPTN